MGAGNTTSAWSANAQNQHGEGKDGKCQLDVLSVNFAGEKGKTSNFIIHRIFSFCLMVLAYTFPGFKTGFKRLKKQP
jgi:hypothetical protein